MCSPPFFLTLLSYWNQWLQPKTNSPVLSADLPFQVRLSFIFPQKISSIQLHLGSLIRSFCSSEASRPAFVCLDVCSLCAPKSVVIIISRKFPSPFIVLPPHPPSDVYELHDAICLLGAWLDVENAVAQSQGICQLG